GGARVGVRSGLLHVTQRDSRIERGGDERVPKRVRADLLANPCAAGDTADDPRGAVPVQSFPIRGAEQRPAGALANGQVDGAGGARGERDRDDLAALAGDDEGPVPAFQTQVLDVGTGGLRYPKPVEGEQGAHGVLDPRAEPGGDQEGAGLVAVQSGGVRLVIQPRPPD